MRPLAASLAFSLLAATAFPCDVFAAKSYWYLGSAVGQSRITATTTEIEEGFLIDDTFVATNTTLDKTSTGWKAYLGYRFNRFLALEGGYADLGKASFNTTIISAPPPFDTMAPFPLHATATAHGGVLSAVLHLPFGESFSLFAKAGAFHWQAEFTEDIPGFGTRVHRTETETDAAYGAGTELRLADTVRFRIEYERFKNVGKGIGGREGRDIDFASAGLLFTF